MKQILCSDWLPEQQDGPILPTRDFPKLIVHRSVHLDVGIQSFLTSKENKNWLDKSGD